MLDAPAQVSAKLPTRAASYHRQNGNARAHQARFPEPTASKAERIDQQCGRISYCGALALSKNKSTWTHSRIAGQVVRSTTLFG